MTAGTQLSWRIAGLVTLVPTVFIVVRTLFFPLVAGINRVLLTNLSIGRHAR